MNTDLLQRYIAGDVTEAERKQVLEWIEESPEHLQEYRTQRKLYDIALWRTDISAGETDAEKRFSWKKPVREMLKIAAVFALVFIGSYYWWNQLETSETVQSVYVPAGQRAELVLADGTKVWLNADSKLYYPVHFGKNNREVSLKGEAYFEVAKDTTRPFIVSTEALNVKVLGTHFDVNSYKDDGRVYTALTEGLVEVYNEHGSRLLHPGQMASVDTREENLSIQVDSCDTSILTGWRDGQFRFRNTSLTQILKQISRCYDVTIILQRDYQEEYYSGDISYHIPLSTLLGAIEASTSVHFDIEGNTVYMRRK